MSWVASGLAVAGGVAGYLGGTKGKKAQSNPYGQLNPEQIGVNKTVGNRLNTLAGQDPQLYGGQLNAEMSPQESAYYNTGRASLMSGTVDNMLNEANDPVAFNNAFNQGMVNPTYQNFNQNELPGMLEGYGAFTTAAGNARAQALQTVGNNLMMNRYTAQAQAKDRALSAMGLTPTLQKYMAAPREIQQAGLDRHYQDYINANEQNGKNMDRALQFLGIRTGTYTPAVKDTRLSGALSGALAGASLGSGISGAFGGGAGGFSSGGPMASSANLSPGSGYSAGGVGLGSGLYDGAGYQGATANSFLAY